MTPAYRPDIDGLRALAVLSVLFFHTGLTLFSGGFVGVDVFFVISGYLITTIIIREIANNEFSVTRFYERRFRRILPSLATMIAACFFASIWILAPKKLINFGESASAATLFSSNIFFYFETGYFDGPAAMKPLLHTWSLAIEEQYYIFFPLLLLLIAKVDAKNYFKWLLILCITSFIACVILTRIDASAAFYLLPTRAWELFIGSILALQILPAPKNNCVREASSALGLGLIAYSIFSYNAETVFPGYAAAAPTIGAAFVIYAGINGTTLVSRILSWRPIVFIGLISYSLYLWHWPLFVYTKIYLIKTPDTVAIVSMVLVSFILAVLSWRYIETPFRKKIFFANTSALLRAAAVCSLFIIGCGAVLKFSNGFPERNRSEITILSRDFTDDEWIHLDSCENDVKKFKNDKSLCALGQPGEARFLLWGDSHAMSVATGVDSSAKRHGRSGVIAYKLSCAPLLGVDLARHKTCVEFNDGVLRYLSDHPEIKTVILAGRWALFTKGISYKQEAPMSIRLTDTLASDETRLANPEIFDTGLNRTFEALHKLGKTVILVNPIPEVGFIVPPAYFVAEVTGRDITKLIAPTASEYQQRTEEVMSSFAKIQKRLSPRIIAVNDALCNAAYCMVIADGQPLYRDDDHLSTFGSNYLSSLFDDTFKNMSAD